MVVVVVAVEVQTALQEVLADLAAAVLGLTETHRQPLPVFKTQDQVVVVVVAQQARRQLARLAALE
jgi:hypothetical protein